MHFAINNVLIFPNPTENELRIHPNAIGTELRIESIEIYNVFGEKVYSETISGTQKEINIKTLAAGIYFVKVKSEKEERVAMFVKQ